jgi:hypothetical protein
MKRAAITDEISQDLAHALSVLAEYRINGDPRACKELMACSLL